MTSWTQAGAVDKTEWVNQIRTVSTAGRRPYYIQESLHPNYWAQLATALVRAAGLQRRDAARWRVHDQWHRAGQRRAADDLAVTPRSCQSLGRSWPIEALTALAVGGSCRSAEAFGPDEDTPGPRGLMST